MNMTHYMELLATNQPWNLIAFMAIPVILAETVAITELFILLDRSRANAFGRINRIASILGGLYFTGVFVYLLFNAAIPLTTQGQWRGPLDVIAVLAYLAGIVPLLGLALMDMGLLFKNKPEPERFKRHAMFVALFLVVAHIAMIFGMLDPSLTGHAADAGAAMGGMDHSGHAMPH